MDQRIEYRVRESENSDRRTHEYSLGRWASEDPKGAPWLQSNLIDVARAPLEDDIMERRPTNLDRFSRESDQLSFNHFRTTTLNLDHIERHSAPLVTISNSRNINTANRNANKNDISQRNNTSHPSRTQQTSITTDFTTVSSSATAHSRADEEPLKNEKPRRRQSKKGQKRGKYNTSPRPPKIFACILGKYLPKAFPDCILRFFCEEYEFRLVTVGLLFYFYLFSFLRRHSQSSFFFIILI